MSETRTPSAHTPAITPGRLRNWVEMSIQTRQAQRLVRGRRGENGKPPIVGLYRYGAMTRAIWSGAGRDDPYADWALLQIEQTLTESKEEVAHRRQTIERDMGQVTAMKIGLAQSLEPVKIELTFSNPYGYMGGWLLVDMDELVLAGLTARHVGLITRDASERLLSDAGRAVRRAFAAAQGYRYLAVTRQDVREDNRKAQRARQTMGELPQGVIDGTLRAEHAPSIERTNAADRGGHSVAAATDPSFDDDEDDEVRAPAPSDAVSAPSNNA